MQTGNMLSGQFDCKSSLIISSFAAWNICLKEAMLLTGERGGKGVEGGQSEVRYGRRGETSSQPCYAAVRLIKHILCTNVLLHHNEATPTNQSPNSSC